MKHGLGVLVLTLAGSAFAAEPDAAVAPVKPGTEKPAAPRKPLDLRVGNIRNYMMPK